jgi:Glycosyl transferases group 1
MTMMRFARRLAVAAYRSADILAPHSSYNRRWQLYGGADPARMRTMYNGVNPDDFPIAQGEPDVPTIVFVGRIDPLKDLHTLIRAFAIVRARIPDARLRMFGPVSKANGKYHASCVQLINELGLSDSATLEGPIARQVDAYQAGHLVALTSVSEGFPFTVVESMAMGRPQVCTNVGGVSEAVGKEVGFIVPPRDHAAVAEACIRLLEDADLRRSCGTLARKRVLERFTLDQWTNAYRDIYAELVPAVPDPTVVPAREGRPPVQWIFDPDKGTLTPAPYARIARELAEAAHSQSPDPDGPNPDDRSGVVPTVHSERAVGASAPLTAADREGMAETAVIRRPLNGTSSQEDDEDTCVVQMIHAHRLVGASAPPAKARHDEAAATAAEPADESAAQPVVQP